MGKRLRTKQLEVIWRLLQGQDSHDIVRGMRLRWSTLSRWRKLPEFIARLEECKRELAVDTEYKNKQMFDQLSYRVAHCINYNIASPREDAAKMIASRLNVLKHLTTSPYEPRRDKTSQNASKLAKTGQDAAEEGESRPTTTPPAPEKQS